MSVRSQTLRSLSGDLPTLPSGPLASEVILIEIREFPSRNCSLEVIRDGGLHDQSSKTVLITWEYLG